MRLSHLRIWKLFFLEARINGRFWPRSLDAESVGRKLARGELS